MTTKKKIKIQIIFNAKTNEKRHISLHCLTVKNIKDDDTCGSKKVGMSIGMGLKMEFLVGNRIFEYAKLKFKSKE